MFHLVLIIAGICTTFFIFLLILSVTSRFIFVSSVFRADYCAERLRASGSNIRVHVLHSLYSSFYFCNTPVDISYLVMYESRSV